MTQQLESIRERQKQSADSVPNNDFTSALVALARADMFLDRSLTACKVMAEALVELRESTPMVVQRKMLDKIIDKATAILKGEI